MTLLGTFVVAFAAILILRPLFGGAATESPAEVPPARSPITFNLTGSETHQGVLADMMCVSSDLFGRPVAVHIAPDGAATIAGFQVGRVPAMHVDRCVDGVTVLGRLWRGGLGRGPLHSVTISL